MRILSIDTSTSIASVAIAVKEQVVAESVFSVDMTLSARLIPEIERLLALSSLALADIDLFACATGPGSFTGVRAGAATIQGLAMATGKPCVGFSTLALLAMNFSLATRPVCSLLDARKQEVYGALYNCSAPIPTALIDDCVLPPEQLLGLVNARTCGPVIFAGEGAVRYRDTIAAALGEKALFAPFPQNTGHAGHGVVLALGAFNRGESIGAAQLQPVYLRASEAEYAKMKRPLR